MIAMLRAVGAVASRLADRVAPVKLRPIPGFWDNEQSLVSPPVIHGRGLGDTERAAEWVDAEGDLWRFNTTSASWEYRCPGGPWIWAGTAPNGYTSPNYAPYRQVAQQLQALP